MNDHPRVVTVNRFKLVKYDGAPPQPGEVKVPAEVIEGGDGLETVITHPQPSEITGLDHASN